MIANRSTVTRPKAAKKRRKAEAPFNVAEALDYARAVLASPPCDSLVVRVKPEGQLVREFALPLGLVEPQDRKAGAPDWVSANVRKQLFALMWAQNGHARCSAPLPGRPQVICVRFSSVPPDKYADSFKVAIDRLCVYRPRKVKTRTGRIKISRDLHLGMIVDDRPKLADVHQTWEPTLKGQGFGYMAVYTGAT